MPEYETSEIRSIELTIPIAAPQRQVWEALTKKTDSWWLADFRALGEGSTVSFDAKPGGTLTESTQDGGGLIWYTGQMNQPETALYLVGHTAPDWGGPTLSMLKLGLRDAEAGCVLEITDTLVGRISDQQAGSLETGWSRLFGDGLKAFVEKGAPQQNQRLTLPAE